MTAFPTVPNPERPDASSSLSSTVAWHACVRSAGSRHGDHLVEADPLAAGAAAVVELRHRSGKKGGQHEELHEVDCTVKRGARSNELAEPWVPSLLQVY